MSDSPTINSRLRVLIAKTFRAEKLYSSLRKPQSQTPANNSQLSEMANELRAREWQRAHTKLRTNLNDILDIKHTNKVATEVLKLKEFFQIESDKCNAALDQSLKLLVDSAKREEFVHSLKVSFELIRLKARMQASHAISEELSAILGASGKQGKTPISDSPQVLIKSEKPLGEDLDEVVEDYSNVIPLKKRFS